MSDAEAEEGNRKLAEAEARFSELCPPVYRHPEILAAMRERVSPGILRKISEWRPHGLKSGLLLYGPTGGFKTTLLFDIA